MLHKSAGKFQRRITLLRIHQRHDLIENFNCQKGFSPRIELGKKSIRFLAHDHSFLAVANIGVLNRKLYKRCRYGRVFRQEDLLAIEKLCCTRGLDARFRMKADCGTINYDQLVLLPLYDKPRHNDHLAWSNSQHSHRSLTATLNH